MTETTLAEGDAWLDRRLFSHASIWRRRPQDRRAVVPYLAMAYLYKRANPLGHLLIRAKLTHSVWWPMVGLTRRRHVRFRRRLAARLAAGWGSVVTPGVEGERHGLARGATNVGGLGAMSGRSRGSWPLPPVDAKGDAISCVDASSPRKSYMSGTNAPLG